MTKKQKEEVSQIVREVLSVQEESKRPSLADEVQKELDGVKHREDIMDSIDSIMNDLVGVPGLVSPIMKETLDSITQFAEMINTKIQEGKGLSEEKMTYGVNLNIATITTLCDMYHIAKISDMRKTCKN